MDRYKDSWNWQLEWFGYWMDNRCINSLIKISKASCEDNFYVCSRCTQKLLDAHEFKRQALDTLQVLQSKRLLKLHKAKDCTVTIMPDDYSLCKVENPEGNLSGIGLEQLREDVDKIGCLYADEAKYETIEQLKIDQPEIKHESIESTFIDNIILIDNKNMSKDNKPPDLNLNLEREKRITVTKRKTKRSVVKVDKKEAPLYRINEDFSCDICLEVLPNLNVYHRHMNKHFPNHTCDVCGKTFLSLKRLRRHTSSHETGPFECGSCDAIFKNYNTMCSHKRRKHGNDDLYKCPQCNERFMTFNRRMLHLAEVHGQNEKKYKCNLCPSTFLISGNLSSHKRRAHLKVKRYYCSQCTSSFFHKEELKSHLAVHSGSRDFKCEDCEKTFLRKKALVVHQKKHADDKRFACEKCGRRFLQKCVLLKHYSVHRNDGAVFV